MTPVPRQGWFLNEFLNGVSQNTGTRQVFAQTVSFCLFSVLTS